MNIKEILKKSMFYGYKVALEGIKRAEEKGKDTIVVKAGASPSGGKHIGNANDVLRAYIIAKCVEWLGYKVKFIHTCDDCDPLRKVPNFLPNENGELVKVDEELKKKLKEEIGRPYYLIEDPFGCHNSWSDHFNDVWLSPFREIGIKVKNYSNSLLYKRGIFDKAIEIVAEKREEIKEIYSSLGMEESKIFMPLCRECLKIGSTELIDFDISNKEVIYKCAGRVIRGENIEGCGFEGRNSWRFGKLPWKLEWPGQWFIFDVDIEPMGKDHYLGSWKVCPIIAERIYNIKAPVPSVYELFLVDKAKMSASKGNIYLLQDMFKIIESEVFLYFYTKRPMMQRDFSIKNIHLLVEEFDKLESTFWKVIEKEERSLTKEESVTIVKYLLCFPEKSIDELKHRKNLKKISYTFAAQIGGNFPKENWNNILEKLGLENDFNLKRIEKAKFWIENYNRELLEKYRIRLTKECQKEIPSEYRKLLAELRERIKEARSEEEIVNAFKLLSSTTNVKEFFKYFYLATIGKEFGPRATNLIAMFGKDAIIETLEGIEKI